MMPIHIDRTINEVYPENEEEERPGQTVDNRWQQRENWFRSMRQYEQQQARVSAADFED